MPPTISDRATTWSGSGYTGRRTFVPDGEGWPGGFDDQRGGSAGRHHHLEAASAYGGPKPERREADRRHCAGLRRADRSYGVRPGSSRCRRPAGTGRFPVRSLNPCGRTAACGPGHGRTVWTRDSQGSKRTLCGRHEQVADKGCFLTVASARTHIPRAGRTADRPAGRRNEDTVPAPDRLAPSHRSAGPRSVSSTRRAIAARPGRAWLSGCWASLGEALPLALAFPLPKPLPCPAPAHLAFPLVTTGFRARAGSSQPSSLPYDLKWLSVGREIIGSGGPVPSTAGGRHPAAGRSRTAGGRA